MISWSGPSVRASRRSRRGWAGCVFRSRKTWSGPSPSAKPTCPDFTITYSHIHTTRPVHLQASILFYTLIHIASSSLVMGLSSTVLYICKTWASSTAIATSLLRPPQSISCSASLKELATTIHCPRYTLTKSTLACLCLFCDKKKALLALHHISPILERTLN